MPASPAVQTIPIVPTSEHRARYAARHAAYLRARTSLLHTRARRARMVATMSPAEHRGESALRRAMVAIRGALRRLREEDRVIRLCEECARLRIGDGPWEAVHAGVPAQSLVTTAEREAPLRRTLCRECLSTALPEYFPA